jgi:hypothetical protein
VNCYLGHKDIDGIGFVFAADGPHAGIDFDNCIGPDGELQDWVKPHLARFRGYYGEISPSGRGIKIFVRGSLDGAPGTRVGGFGPDGKGAIEIYDCGRFFTVTGNAIEGSQTTIEDNSEALIALYNEIRPKPKPKATGKAKAKADGGESAPPDEDDQEDAETAQRRDKFLLGMARRARNKEKFIALYDRGDITGYTSQSEADQALLNILAFWANKNRTRIVRLFLAGALGERSKADRADYLDRSVAEAIAFVKDGYPAPWMNEEEDDTDENEDDRSVITLTADHHIAVDQAVATLSGHESVFRRVYKLVRVVRHRAGSANSKGVRRADGTPLIAPFTVASARTVLSRVARFRHWDKRAKGWDWKAPPRDIVESALEACDYPEARELVGIIEAPTLRPDGSLLDRPGYDPATGLLYLPNDTYPPIPERPTEAELLKAKDDLLYPVSDFPFKGDCDRAAWLSSVLTLAARGAVDGAVPGYLVSANLAGTGKTWLAILAALIASGRVPAMDGYAADPAEMEKILVGLAVAGDRCVVFDNAPNGSAIGSAPLDRAITARRSFRGRLLGRNEQSTDLPWCAVVFITGNNLGTRDDSLRRFIPMFLEFAHEHPEARDPKKYRVYLEHGLDLSRYVLRERPRLVAASLTLIRGYLTADVDPYPLPALDFPEWEGLVRQAVYHVAGADPYGSHAELEADDETSAERYRLVNAWARLCEAAFKPEGLTTDEAAEKLIEIENDPDHKPLVITFRHWARRGLLPDAKALGYLLRKHKNSTTSCGSIRCDDTNHDARRWRVKRNP